MLLAQLLSLVRQLMPSLRQHQLHHSGTPEAAWHRKVSSHAIGCELPIIIRAGRRLFGLRLATHDTMPRAGDDKFYFEKLSRLTQSI
jgi:hypothetical protein